MMGIVHHANYIRWMEEARIDYMEQLGWSYAKMEEEGVLSPVRAVNCSYQRPSTFGDVISIRVWMESFNGVVLAIRYERRNEKEETVCTARSEHVFVGKGGRLIRLRKEMPDFCLIIEREIRAAGHAEAHP